MGAIIGIILGILVIGGGLFWYNSWDRVDPGNVGILVDYGDGSIEPVTDVGWKWIGRYQKLVEYNAQEQTYVMDRGDEGQIKGDDSTLCTTGDSQQLKIDSATNWRIDPTQVVQVYQYRRDVPLTGKWGREAAGNFLEDIIIRNAVRSAIYKICPEYNWSDLMGTKQVEFQARIDADVRETAPQQGVVISAVTIRNRHPSDAILALMNARLEGQKQQETSAFLAAQQKRQQEIDQTAAVAAQQKAQIEAEGQARVKQTQAEADANVARAKSQAEADAIRSKGAAEAAAIQAQAASITPQLVELERARKWNGQGPTTILSGNEQLVNQIPLQR